MVNQGPCTRLEEDILGTTLWLLGRIAIWCHLDKQEKKITVFFYFANLWNLHNFSSFPDFVNIYSSLYCVLETISPSAMKFSCPPSDNLPKKKKTEKNIVALLCLPSAVTLSCHSVSNQRLVTLTETPPLHCHSCSSFLLICPELSNKVTCRSGHEECQREP